jgi:CMP-N-acetylneuraminic acid synthetase
MIGIIPARKNSKRLPDKNLHCLNGKTLIDITLENAVKSELEHVYVTTDLKNAANYGDHPKVKWIRRPDVLCTDEAKIVDVISDLLETVESYYDSFCLLQPTSPLRTYEDINNAINIYKSSCKESLYSTSRVLVKNFNGTQEERYQRNGAIFITNTKYFIDNKKLYGSNNATYIMPPWRSVDIDTYDDFIHCKLINKGLTNE